MTFIKTAVSAVALALAATASHAQEVRLGAGLALFGPSLEAQVALTDSFSLRGMWSGGLSATGNTTADGLDYSVDASIGATSLLATYHIPGGLRMSGGFLMPNTTINGTTSSAGGATVGGVVIPGAFDISSTTTFVNDFAPMATMGFDFELLGAVLSTDAGVVKTGGFDVSLTQTSGAAIGDSNLRTAETTIEGELNRFDYLPYFSVMVGRWF